MSIFKALAFLGRQWATTVLIKGLCSCQYSMLFTQCIYNALSLAQGDVQAAVREVQDGERCINVYTGSHWTHLL